MEFYLVQKDNCDVQLFKSSKQTFNFDVKLNLLENACSDGSHQALFDKFVEGLKRRFDDKEWVVTMELFTTKPGWPSSRDSSKGGVGLRGEILTELQQFLYGEDNLQEPLQIEMSAECKRLEISEVNGGGLYERVGRIGATTENFPPLTPQPVVGTIKAKKFTPKKKENDAIDHSWYFTRSLLVPPIPPHRLGCEVVDTWTVKVKVSAKTFICLEDTLPPAGTTNRQFLEDKSFCDFTIISGDGTRIPCHKLFLSRCPTFLTMLQGHFEEAKKNEVEIVDMTTPGVNALLEYFYCDDVSQAMNHCEITVELLQAADKYDLPVLWEAMTAVIWGKSHSWFEVDEALKVFDFVSKCKREESPKLMKKMLQVISLKPDQLSKSALFTELFSSATSRELFMMSLETNRP